MRGLRILSIAYSVYLLIVCFLFFLFVFYVNADEKFLHFLYPMILLILAKWIFSGSVDDNFLKYGVPFIHFSQSFLILPIALVGGHVLESKLVLFGMSFFAVEVVWLLLWIVCFKMKSAVVEKKDEYTVGFARGRASKKIIIPPKSDFSRIIFGVYLCFMGFIGIIFTNHLFDWFDLSSTQKFVVKGDYVGISPIFLFFLLVIVLGEFNIVAGYFRIEPLLKSGRIGGVFFFIFMIFCVLKWGLNKKLLILPLIDFLSIGVSKILEPKSKG